MYSILYISLMTVEFILFPLFSVRMISHRFSKSGILVHSGLGYWKLQSGVGFLVQAEPGNTEAGVRLLI